VTGSVDDSNIVQRGCQFVHIRIEDGVVIPWESRTSRGQCRW
jgi:hypothetical protein